MTNKKNKDNVYDIHVIAKNLNHNERIALFEYIRITKENVKKEIFEDVENMIVEFPIHQIGIRVNGKNKRVDGIIKSDLKQQLQELKKENE